MFRGCRAWPLLRQLAGVAGGTATWLGAGTVPGKGSIFLAALFGLRTPLYMLHTFYSVGMYLICRYVPCTEYLPQWSNKGPRTGTECVRSSNKESDTESGSHLTTNWQPRNARRTIFSISRQAAICALLRVLCRLVAPATGQPRAVQTSRGP